MRAFLAFLLLAPAIAQAAPPCWPHEANASRLEVSSQPSDKLAALSAPDGSFAVSWWCDMRYEYVRAGFVGWTRNLSLDWYALLRGAQGSSSGLSALWTAKTKCDLGTVGCEEYAPLVPILQRQWAATAPDPIVWRVKRSFSKTATPPTTRPVYPLFASGDRSSTALAGVRAKIGDVCACTKSALEEEGGTYCSVAGLPNVTTAGVATGTTIPDGAHTLCERL